MFTLGTPLGWDESYRDNTKKQVDFFQLQQKKMSAYNNQTEFFFSEVIDNLTLIHVIRQEMARLNSLSSSDHNASVDEE